MSSSHLHESMAQRGLSIRLLLFYPGFLDNHLGLLPSKVTEFLMKVNITIENSPQKVRDVVSVLEESENELVESFLNNGGYGLINTCLEKMQTKKNNPWLLLSVREEAIKTQLKILEFIRNHPINRERVELLKMTVLNDIIASEYEDEQEIAEVAEEILEKVDDYERNVNLNENPSSSSQTRSNQIKNGCRAYKVVDKINSIVDSVIKTPRLVDDDSTAFDRIRQVLQAEMPNLRSCSEN